MKLSINFATILFSLLIATPLTVVVAGEKAKPSAGITNITKRQLNTRVPHFYCFDYDAEPQPGKRYWLRISDDLWIERYPNGLESKFKVVGHTRVMNTNGTIVVKVSGDEEQTGTTNDGRLQAFIPDKGSKLMHHWYRNCARGDEEWNDLGPMLSVE